MKVLCKKCVTVFELVEQAGQCPNCRSTVIRDGSVYNEYTSIVAYETVTEPVETVETVTEPVETVETVTEQVKVPIEQTRKRKNYKKNVSTETNQTKKVKKR